MATKINRYSDGRLKSIDVSCNTCGKVETDAEIVKAGGLLKMGWLRRFNDERCESEHFCPEHHPKEESRGN